MAGSSQAAPLLAAASLANTTSRSRLAVTDPLLESLDLLLANLQIERRAPVAWDYAQIRYSLTVPSEDVATAIIATVAPVYQGAVNMTFYVPDEGRIEPLFSGRSSSFADVPTEEAKHLVLELRYGQQVTNYSIYVLRSTVTSAYQFGYPDPAVGAPPEATLTGLMVFDASGIPARMKPPWFTPRRSQYIATLDLLAEWARLTASQNDPDATLSLRVNGQEWSMLQPGISSPLQAVPQQGWLLFEVQVLSPTVVAAGRTPLVYQVVVARQAICHVRCRSCYGPGPEQCLRCRAPLVLYDGRCEATACPPNAYYEWQSYQCRTCHPSCAACNGPDATACTLCPALNFKAGNWEDLAGTCVASCPYGTFAHPPSRRCRRPPSVVVKTFYVRHVFRVAYASAQRDTRLQESILNTTAFVLGLSLSDVRPYNIAQVSEGRLQITIEVVSPFLPRADADRVDIDAWFGAFEVPVDEITTLSWDDLHPPLPVRYIDPLLPAWAWGLMASTITALLLVVPLYWFYFRRLANSQKRYTARSGVDPTFLNAVVDQPAAWLIRRFVAQDAVARMQLQQQPPET